MTYHKIAVCFIILLTITACQGGKRMMQNVMPSMKAEQLPLVPAPPPSPRAAQDQVNLPPQTRSLRSSIFSPLDTDITIGLMLPLTGSNAALGKELQDAAQLALFDIKNTELKIVPLDTEGTPEGALNAINQAVAAQADIIVGPLFSQEASVIAPIAKMHDIPVISFSNNVDLAKQDVFVFGFMPQQQIVRVMEYALQRGIRDYYIIAPDDAFGKATLETIDLLRNRYAFTIHVTANYNASTNQGLVDAARSVAKHIQAAKKLDDGKKRALLIPEGGSKLLEISKLISGFGLNANDVRLIGSGQWDDTSLGKYRRLYGGWFATASPTQRTIFEKHFEQTYHYKPVRIASIAYDAVALVGFLSQQSGNRLSTSSIVNERGFAGVDGAFRFAPDHIAERSLAVLEVIPNGFEIVDEAPKMLKNYSN